MEKRIKQAYSTAKNSKKVRFGLVGVINTLVDISILNILVHFIGLALIPANITSTSFAMLVSFTLNKTAVFRKNDRKYARQLVLFFAVTLVGVWIIQTGVFIGVYTMLESVLPWPDVLLITMAKIVGVGVGMIWNYMWYSRVVFRSTDKEIEL